MDSPSSRGVVQVQPMSAPTTQRATLVATPSATSTQEAPGNRNLLPALEHLQRISHQRSPSSGSASALPPLSSRSGPFMVDEAGVAPGPSAPPHQHLYQRLTGLPHPSTAPVTGRPPVHPSTSVTVSTISSIAQSQQAASLPTYRQANNNPLGDGGDGASNRPPSSPLTSIMSSSPAMDPSLPDLLHSHMVPPQVPPARPNQHRHQRRSATGRGASGDGGGGGNNGQRRHHRRSQQGQQAGSRQRRRSRTMSGGSTNTASAGEGGVCKEPCVRCVVKVTSFRWVLVLLSVLGVCCVVTGVVLAALRAAGNSFLFLAIMFIGLGILLVIVVIVGWKCTPRGHEPLHALFGIGNFRGGRSSGQTRERRRRRHRNRDGNWYGGVLYPEFQYRRPPPSYAASMQDYQNHQLQHGGGDADRGSGRPGSNVENSSLPNSPPPSYRSRSSTAHSGIHIAFPGAGSSGNAGSGGTHDGDLPGSRPPTYRSRAPSRRPSIPRNDPSDNINDGGDVDFGNSQTFNEPVAGPSQLYGSRGEVPGQAGTVSTSPSVSQGATGSPSSSSSPHSPGSVTVQVYTLPTVRADNQNPSSSSTAPSSTQFQTTPVSGARTSSTTISVNTTALSTSTSSPTPAVSTTTPSSSHPSAGVVSVSSVPPARLPSLHQRMESGDRRMLEDALQSLEEHMDSDEGAGSRHDGIVNLGASFDPEETTEHFNTHL